MDRKGQDSGSDWYTVKYGYFVLVSNIDTSPKELLSDYFGRTDILDSEKFSSSITS